MKEMRSDFNDSKLVIPYKKLSQTALNGVIENFILREGTDYGHTDCTLDKKKKDVMNKLENGSALVFFDLETKSSTIILVEELSKLREKSFN